MSDVVLVARFRRLTAFIAALWLLGVLVFVPLLAAATVPELPRLSVDTTYVPPSGRTLAVPTGGNFQAALNAAQPGDVITLEAGATFRGSFRLPNKPGSGWIIVRTSAPDSRLPTPGTQVDPSYASVMPKLEAAWGTVIATAPGAHHYRFIGVEIRPKADVFLYNLVTLGVAETTTETLPDHIIFDRCYLHGDPKKGTRRGIAMNSRSTAVIDSYLSDFKEAGADSQAIAGWNGSGPFKIANNYLEGAGENVMFGGVDPAIVDLVPADIEIRRNHFSKPLSWKVDDPSYAGTPWTIKNLFELKNARRVLVEGNLFENSWAHAQVGFAILFTVRNQDGGAPWSVVEDVTFRNNIVRRAAGGVNILGSDNNFPSQQTKRITIRNNLFEDIGGHPKSGNGRLFQVVRGAADVVIEHNTAFQKGSIMVAEGEPNARFVFRNNIVPHNEYGVTGTGTGTGIPTLNRYFPGFVFEKNVIVGNPSPSLYPARNFYPPSFDRVGFVDPVRGDYRLAASSRYKKAGTDGTDVGADFTVLSAATGTAPQRQSQHDRGDTSRKGG